MPSYKYYNHNPDNLRLKDCVCRAISVATNLCYEAVDNLLELTARDYVCDKLCMCCYSKLLEDVLCYNRDNCDFKKTVLDIASEFPRNKVLIRVPEHLTVSVYGSILDIWDCSEEPVDCYWIIS
jgi:hypothetical protein